MRAVLRVHCLLFSLTALVSTLSLSEAAAGGISQPRSTAAESDTVVARESALTPEALSDSLNLLLAEIALALAPVREWRRNAEAALRPDSATARADTTFLRLRDSLSHTVHLATRAFHRDDFQVMVWPDGAAADYRRRMRGFPRRLPDPAEQALADSVRSYLAGEGIWTSHGEGTAYFNPSESALLSWLGRFVTPQIDAFLRFEAAQQVAPFADDGSLMVTLEALAQRLVTVEQLLDRFPDSPARPLLTYTYHQYLAAYLGGLPNTGAFDWRTRALSNEFRRSHQAFLRLHGSTAAGRVVAEYVRLLQRTGYRRTPEIDAFLLARWKDLDPRNTH